MHNKWGFLVFLAILAVTLGACGESASPTPAIGNDTPSLGAPTQAVTATPTLGADAAHATQTVALAGGVTQSGVTSGPASVGGPTATLGPKGGVTMKEAYNLVAGQIQNWSKDAVLTTITVDPDDQYGLLADGRADSWFFTAVSASMSKQDSWQVKAPVNTKASVAETVGGDIDQQMLSDELSNALPPVTSLIDSNRLMEVARQNGGDKSDVPVGFELHKSSNPSDPLAFNLVFQNGSQVTPLRIDAQTGKLLANVKG